MTHKVSRVILFVADMARMANFYSYLMNGRDKPDFDEHWTEIESAGLSLALHKGGTSDPKKRQDIKLCFHAPAEENVDDLMSRIGATFISERSPVEGLLVKDFKDPEGNDFSIEIF